MDFLISDTFTGSLAQLSADEQKQVKTTAFDLQMHPENPGHQFHRLQRAKDPNFWSVRVGRDLRLIVHRSADSLLLCYAAHHDPASGGPRGGRVETHPKTGAAQLVEIRERVEEMVIPKYVEEGGPRRKANALAGVPESELLSYGVPAEWMDDVRGAPEDSVLPLWSIFRRSPQKRC